MSKMRKRWILMPLLAVTLACSPPDPLERLRQQLARYPLYSVILQDMKTEGSFSVDYFHQYKVVVGEQVAASDDVSFSDNLMAWKRVSKSHYQRYQPFLGMVILSKDKDGKVTGSQFPPGYQYVGDQRYGHWRTGSSGGSFWEFYGKYAMMSHLFGSFNRPIYRNDWNSYRTTRSQGRPYYGANKEFGTKGSYTKTSNPSFYDRQKVRQQRSGDRFSRKVSERTRRSNMSSTRSRSTGRGGGK